MKSLILKVVLAIAIIALGYLLYTSIMKPIHFQEELTKRNAQIANRVKDIRSAQTLYKQFNNAYTSSFDTLFNFLKTGQIPIIRMVPDPADTTFTRTISDTLGFVAIQDSLFSKRPNFNIQDMAIIPFSDGRKFVMNTDKVDKGGVMVPVIEILVPYEYYLSDLPQQEVVNLGASQVTMNRYPGIRMGSLVEATTDGNWE